MDNYKKYYKIFIGIAIAGVIAIGGIIGNIFFGDDKIEVEKGCYFTVRGLNQNNLYDKLIERIEVEPVKRTIKFKCDLETVSTSQGLGYKYTDKNCITMSKSDYLEYRADVFDKIGSKKNFLLNYKELKQTQQEFADIWNYTLFQSCEVVE